jgi:hypothetical protein
LPNRFSIAAATSWISSSVPVSRTVTNPPAFFSSPSPLRDSASGIDSVPPCGAERMIGNSPACTVTSVEASTAVAV